MRDPSCVTAMRVPGLIPSDCRISDGMTNCPFVLTNVICRTIAYIVAWSKTQERLEWERITETALFSRFAKILSRGEERYFWIKLLIRWEK